jgi:hypothetical protein
MILILLLDNKVIEDRWTNRSWEVVRLGKAVGKNMLCQQAYMSEKDMLGFELTDSMADQRVIPVGGNNREIIQGNERKSDPNIQEGSTKVDWSLLIHEDRERRPGVEVVKVECVILKTSSHTTGKEGLTEMNAAETVLLMDGVIGAQRPISDRIDRPQLWAGGKDDSG